MTWTNALTTVFSSITWVITDIWTPVIIMLAGIALLSLIFKIKH